MLAKPHLAIGIGAYYAWRWRKGRSISPRSLPLLALWMYCIYRTAQEQLRLRSIGLRPGVFAFGKKANKLCSISDIRRLVLGYTPPLGLWNGDLLTVIPSLAQPKNLPDYERLVFRAAGQEHMDDGDWFATDWAFPTAPWNRRVAVLIAGVGGNSKARYIVEIAEQFLAEGYIVCVLNPRKWRFYSLYMPRSVSLLVECIRCCRSLLYIPLLFYVVFISVLYLSICTLKWLLSILCSIPIFTLYSLLFTLYSLLFTLYSLLFTLYSLLFTLYSLLFTLYSLLFTLYSLLFTLYSLLFTLYSLLFTLYSLLFTLYSLLFTLYSLLFTLYSLLFTLYSLLFTLYSLLFTLYSLLFTLYSLLFTLYSRLSTLDSRLSILYPRLSTVYCLLLTLDSVLFTLYS